MMQSIEDMPNQPNAIWFDEDDITYQRGTDRIPAVYILMMILKSLLFLINRQEILLLLVN
jgi:hypothetical protein